MSLEVACQSAVVADPAERPLDASALGQHDEAMLIAVAQDIDLPTIGTSKKNSVRSATRSGAKSVCLELHLRRSARPNPGFFAAAGQS
jgi:hypothetical protein